MWPRASPSDCGPTTGSRPARSCTDGLATGSSSDWSTTRRRATPSTSTPERSPPMNPCVRSPGESLTYRFTADLAGIWMYHCSTMPMSAHIANGMFGAVVIEPPTCRRSTRALSWCRASSTTVRGASRRRQGPKRTRRRRVPTDTPTSTTTTRYRSRPVTTSGSVLDAGPNRATAFHVVVASSTTTWAEGSHLLRDAGADRHRRRPSPALAPPRGGFVELTLTEAGHCPFVSHVMVDAERGAHGLLSVERPRAQR